MMRYVRQASPVHAGIGWTVVACLTTILANPCLADLPAAPKASPEQIATLVRELGSDRFSTREAASDQLARIGLPAFTALEEASRHADREIRFRAERILTLIRKHDLERRLAAFLAGTGKDDYDLPAWSRFQKDYGDTDVSRKLFVEMQRAEPELLAAFHRDPRSSVEILGRRLAERIPMPVRGGNVSLPAASSSEVSAYLFVAAAQDAPVSSSSLFILLGLCSRTTFVETLRSTKDGDLARKMLAGVICRCDGESSYPAINLAMEMGMKEGLIPAVKMLEQNAKLNPNVPQYTATALCCVAEMGDGSHVPAAEKFLDDQRVLTTSTSRMVRNGETTTLMRELQVRDVALATLVILTKQDAKEYFGQPIPPRPASSAVNAFNRFPVQIFGFEKVDNSQNVDPRKIALKKWEDYKSLKAKEKPGDVQPAGAAVPVPANEGARREKSSNP